MTRRSFVQWIGMFVMTIALAQTDVHASTVLPQGKRNVNPLIGEWHTPDGVPPYDQIQTKHYLPAFKVALAQARREVTLIARNPRSPSFENTIEAMERSFRLLARTENTFFTVASADATPAIQRIEAEISPRLSQFYSELYLNQRLFRRVDTLWQSRQTLGLDAQKWRLLEVTRKEFVRAGAGLTVKGRKRIAAIGKALSKLNVEFNQRIQADQKLSRLFLTEEQLSGLSDEFKAAAANQAKANGKPELFLINASRSDFEQFLTSGSDRAARELVFNAFNQRGDNKNANDTQQLITKTLRLRAEWAQLFKSESYAHFVLDDTMAKTPKDAMALLHQVYEPALRRAKQEERDLLELAKIDGITTLEPWDWRYYSEKIRQQRFSIDEAALKPYYTLDGVLAALFDTTNRLYGLRFHLRSDVPVYADGVRVWEIRDEDNSPIGLFYGDWFTRSTKQPGAWMNSIRTQSFLLNSLPIVVNNANFTPAPPGQPTLLSLDEAATIFHEFGHALHGLLSKVRYPRLSGTAVTRDFVEFPSQVYEHWIEEPEVLRRYAVNVQGEVIPDALLRALAASKTFNQGFATVQLLSSAILDLDLHGMKEIPKTFDPGEWEAQRLDALQVPHAVGMRHRLPHFSHIFGGGYASAYYAYIWAETMDADGFDAFKEVGNIFDPITAQKLRKEVLERGNTRDPAESYIAFRGRLPNGEALLRNRGLQ